MYFNETFPHTLHKVFDGVSAQISLHAIRLNFVSIISGFCCCCCCLHSFLVVRYINHMTLIWWNKPNINRASFFPNRIRRRKRYSHHKTTNIKPRFLFLHRQTKINNNFPVCECAWKTCSPFYRIFCILWNSHIFIATVRKKQESCFEYILVLCGGSNKCVSLSPIHTLWLWIDWKILLYYILVCIGALTRMWN